MDMLPMSAMSEERSRNQYLADVTQESEERQRRNVDTLDPDAQETRDRWNATQVTTHERSFPFSDNLTTLMFIVASDLGEAQKERLTSALSLKGLNVTVYTLEAVKTVFVELFCSPKSSMDNPSLRVSGHGGSTNRTFIAENFAEDEFGRWATDEVTGEQGYIDDGKSCFWTWDDNEYTLQSRPSKGRQVRRRGKGKRTGKGGFKGTGRAFLGEEQAQDPEWWSEEDCAWWSKGREARKVFSKGNEGFQKGGFRTYQPEKSASNDFNPHKGRGKDQQVKGKEGAYPHSGLSASETHSEEGYSHAWESDDRYFSLTDDSSTSATGGSCSRAYTAWMASAPFEPCQPSDARCSGSWLHTVNWIKSGNQKVPETCVVLWHDDRIFAVANKSSVFANSETETCWESCIIHFPKTPPCFTRVYVLETGRRAYLILPFTETVKP